MKSPHNCYAGKILRVDLASGSIKHEALDQDRIAMPQLHGGNVAQMNFVIPEYGQGVDLVAPTEVDIAHALTRQL